MVDVKELEDIEVEEVETVAALADEKKRTPGKDCRNGMGTTEAEDEGGKYRSEKAAMHEEVRGVSDQSVEEDANDDEADDGENETLAWSEDEGMLHLSQRDAGEEGTEVREGGVFEKADELSGAVAIDGTDDVVGVEVEIKRVRDETDDP
jgi:hypothetical protein